MFIILLEVLDRERGRKDEIKHIQSEKKWGKPFLYTDKFPLSRKVYSFTRNYSTKWITWAKKMNAKFVHKSCLTFYILTIKNMKSKLYFAIASTKKILRVNLTKEVCYGSPHLDTTLGRVWEGAVSITQTLGVTWEASSTLDFLKRWKICIREP